MARYYALEISQTLFGDACLTRSWAVSERGTIRSRASWKAGDCARERS
ncbi:hypothetical protein [Ensifer sp. 4252]